MNKRYRRLIAPLLAMALVAVLNGQGVLTSAQQKPGGKLVVIGPGGTYQQAAVKAYFEPFEKLYGVKVLKDASLSVEAFAAQAQTGHPNFDVADGDFASLLIERDKGLLEPIEYKYFDPADLKAIPADAKTPYSIKGATISLGLAYSTQAFPQGGPKSWADFWDVKKFPGKRAMPACDQAEGTQPDPEAAVLAAGVPLDKVYPIDIPLALKKLKELSPHVLWYKDIAQPQELMISKEATMALAASGRVNQLVNKGAPLAYVWNQSRRGFNVWRVVRGAPNKENAMRFLAFVSRPGPQAEFSKMTTYGPTNPRAFSLLTRKQAMLTPTFPDNLKVSFPNNQAWWHDHRAKFIEECLNTVGR